MSSREDILGRVRAALHRNAGNAATDHGKELGSAGNLGHEFVSCEWMVQRLGSTLTAFNLRSA